MANKSDGPRFDPDAMGERIAQRLRELGVDLHSRDDSNVVAQKFVARLRERGREDAVRENPFGHPLWAHFTSAHPDDRSPPHPDCKLCGLLYAHWLPYRGEFAVTDPQRLRIAARAKKALSLLDKVADLLEPEPAAHSALDFLDAAAVELGELAAHALRIQDPDTRQRLRRGRPRNHLLLSIEAALTKTGFDDRDIAMIVFGTDDQPIIRAIRDRRRSARKRPRRGAGGKAPSEGSLGEP